MEDNRYRVVRTWWNGNGDAVTVATGLDTVEEAATVAFRMQKMNDDEGGPHYAYIVQPD